VDWEHNFEVQRQNDAAGYYCEKCECDPCECPEWQDMLEDESEAE
jgi:hypothetical protein